MKRLEAIGMMAATTVAFAVLDTTAKYLVITKGIGAGQVTWLLFLSLGVWGGLGHWLLILAHRWAPAAVLAPFFYLGLIWMSFFGYLLFADVPNWWTLAGGAVVILSGLYLFARERKAVGPLAAGPVSDIATQSVDLSFPRKRDPVTTRFRSPACAGVTGLPGASSLCPGWQNRTRLPGNDKGAWMAGRARP